MSDGGAANGTAELATDALFDHIEKLQDSVPWGGVLDAGTGRHSLRWVCSLPTERWTAVTGEPGQLRTLEREFRRRMRSQDRLVCGNWSDPQLLHGEVYDVVLADYLLGALERFAPYLQDRLFERLRPLVGGRLYVVGLEPFPETADTAGGRLILEVARMRDACILLAGDRCYREYPLEWALRHLERAGFSVEDARSFGNVFGRRFIDEQLAVAKKKLPYIQNRELAQELGRAIADLREQATALLAIHKGFTLGEDYVVFARPL